MVTKSYRLERFFLVNEHSPVERSKRLLLAIYYLVSDLEQRIVPKDAAAALIGLEPNYRFDDEREFIQLAQILENAGYITSRSVSYESVEITQQGLHACEELSG
jgi:hypothetical protein